MKKWRISDFVLHPPPPQELTSQDSTAPSLEDESIPPLTPPMPPLDKLLKSHAQVVHSTPQHSFDSQTQDDPTFFPDEIALSPIKPALQSHSEAATASKLPQAKPAPQPNPPTHAASKIPHAEPALQTKPPTASKAPQAKPAPQPKPPTHAASKIPHTEPALQTKPPTASKAPQVPNPPTASKIPKAALQLKQHITDNDKKRLLSDAWLTDTDINAAHKLLAKQFPAQHGLQDTLILDKFDRYASSSEDFVQVINICGNHWVCASNRLSPPGMIYVYDSLPVCRGQFTSELCPRGDIIH